LGLGCCSLQKHYTIFSQFCSLEEVRRNKWLLYNMVYLWDYILKYSIHIRVPRVKGSYLAGRAKSFRMMDIPLPYCSSAMN
jgi:hypothetical protein